MTEPDGRPRPDAWWPALYRGALGAAAVLLAAGGIALLLRSGAPAPLEVLLPTPTPAAPASVTVNVSGAVTRPGVYTLASGARTADLVEASGGLLQGADGARVNLAQRLRDEDHVHIPLVGEAMPVIARQPSARDAPGVVNVNTASAEALQTLPGIGTKRAADIVQYRERNGPFRSVDDLLLVSGIGPSTLDGLRDLVTVGAP